MANSTIKLFHSFSLVFFFCDPHGQAMPLTDHGAAAFLTACDALALAGRRGGGENEGFDMGGSIVMRVPP